MVDELLTAGIRREILDEGAISVYTIKSLDSTGMARWSESVAAYLQNLPAERKLCGLVYDLSGGGVSLPYLVYNQFEIDNVLVLPRSKTQADTILEERRDLMVMLALILANTMTGNIASRRGRQTTEMNPQIRFKIFFERDEALSWMRQYFHPTAE